MAIISSRSSRTSGTLKAKAMDTEPRNPPHQSTVCSGKEISDAANQLLNAPKPKIAIAHVKNIAATVKAISPKFAPKSANLI